MLLTIRKAQERERLRRANQLLRRDVERSMGELPDFAERSAKKPDDRSWTAALPLRPRAMVRADRRLFIGGMPRGADPEGGLLDVVSCRDGRTLGRVDLGSPPVWDGMAAAGGRLYLSLCDGTVVCLR